MREIALIAKRFLIRLATVRNYSNAQPKQSVIEVPLDRIYEHNKTGSKFIITNDYSVARNGITDHKEFVIYYPEKFKISLNKYYEEIKYNGIKLIKKFNLAKPGTKYFIDKIGLRNDLIAGFTLITDTPNTDNVDFARAYHDYLLFLNIHDDFTSRLIPQSLVKFQMQWTEKLKIVHELKVPKLFDKTDSRMSSEEKLLADYANNLIMTAYDIYSRLNKHCSRKVFENFYESAFIYYDYSVIENNLIRQTKPLLWNDFINVGPYQTTVQSTTALIDHNEPVRPPYDTAKTLASLYCRLFNDVLSYYKELQTLEKARHNSVSVLQNMYPNMNREQAMTEVMKMQNKILRDWETNVEYLRGEEKPVYIKFFKHAIGFTEAQLVSQKFGWKRISGTQPVYETIELNGVIYCAQ